MVAKEMARTVIDSLPQEASLDEIIHALYVRAKFERGEREIRQGLGIPHEEVKKRLQKWVK
jgi:predicted transcriptional regulator